MSVFDDPRYIQRKQLIISEEEKYSHDELRLVLDTVIPPKIDESGVSYESFGSDTPISNAKEDVFGFSQLAQTLKSHILSLYLQMPLTLCIDGYWGSGKSSLAKLIFSSLEKESFRDGCLPIWIDSSLISGSDNVVSVFANQLRREASQIALRITSKREDKLSLGRGSLVPVTFLPKDKHDQDEEKLLIKHLESYAANWLSKWGHESTYTWTYDSFRTLIRDVRSALLGGGGLSRIVWFIDDLDRCEANVIISILQLHRSLLEEWGTILIYAMDYRIIASVVGQHFLNDRGVYTPPNAQFEKWNTAAVQGQMYLEKFFSVRVRPPEPTEQTLKVWLIRQIGSDCYFNNLEHFLILGFANNPRYIKRFISGVKFLKRNFKHAEEKSLDWDGLKELQNDELALKIMTKVAAIALTSHLEPFYELARSPHGIRLKQLESLARTRTSVPCISETGEEYLRPIPSDLEILLLLQPSFMDLDVSERVLNSAIMGVERILPTPRHRSRLWSMQTAVKLEPQSGGENQTAPPPSSFDRQKVESLVESWRKELQNKIELPETVRSILTSPVPNFVVQLFQQVHWKPAIYVIVNAAEYLLNGRDFRTAAWLWCVASVHPDWGLQEIDRLSDNLELLKQIELAHVLYDIAARRYPDNQTAHLQLALILARMKDSKLVEQGLVKCLSLMEIAVEDLEKSSATLKDKFNIPEYIELYLAANDAFNFLDWNEKRLKFNQIAFKTQTGRDKTEVKRNLASCFSRLNDADRALELYNAAIVTDESEIFSCWWSAELPLSQREQLQRIMVVVDRMPHLPRSWYYVGAKYYALHEFEIASWWLTKAYSMAPGADGATTRLLTNIFSVMPGARQFIETINKGDPLGLSSEKETEFRQLARQAHHELIQSIIENGKIQYMGHLLFDPKELPSWISTEFSKENADVRDSSVLNNDNTEEKNAKQS